MFTFNLFKKTHKAATLAEACVIYCSLRDKSGLGNSGMPKPEIFDASGARVGRFSYNGKIWASEDYTPGEEPIYSPYAVAA